jgi:cytochrome c6
MKNLIKVAILFVSLIAIGVGNPAWAGDIERGAQIFNANCASCHIGGKNVVNPAKTLQKGDLIKYEMYGLDQIKAQVTKGKAAMPGFLGRLSEADIDDVASYVLAQSETDWTGK